MLIKYTMAEVYRILKMKSTYVMLIIMAALFFLGDFVVLAINFGALLMGEGSLFGHGMYYDNSVAQNIAMNTSTSLGMLLMAIFAGNFYGMDYASHYHKNFINLSSCRWVGITAKTFALMIYIFVYQVAVAVVTLFNTIVWGKKLDLGFGGDIIIYTFLIYLLYLAMAVTVGVVTNVTKSKAAGIVFGVLYASGLVQGIISITDFIIRVAFKIENSRFSVGDLLLTYHVSNLRLESDDYSMMAAILCGVAYFVISYVSTLLVVRKRDIN